MRSNRVAALLACGLVLCAACRRGSPAEDVPEPPGLPPSPGNMTWPILPAPSWYDDGSVRAVAVADDGTVYVGGTFTRMGPMTGGGVPLTLDSGQPKPTFPKVDGSVHAVVPDGSGGWYVGGSFERVGGEPRANLAHVLADGSLDPSWSPAVGGYSDPYVEALAFDGTTVYVGGIYDTLDGEARTGLGAVDTSGRVTAWAPQLSRLGYTAVHALAVRGGAVYVGGLFDAVNAEPRACLAAVGTDGTVTAWTPGGTETWGYPAHVDALAVVADVVYVVGRFDQLGGQPRPGIAAVDLAGAVTAWNPWPYTNASGASMLAADGDTLYVGGTFEAAGGQARSGLAAFDAAGALLPWKPAIAGERFPTSGRTAPLVDALAVSGGIVYVSGTFTRAGGLDRNGLAAFDASGAATGWDPDVDERQWVSALAADGAGVYAGGAFQWIGKATKRAGLAAIDPSGAVTDWNPGIARLSPGDDSPHDRPAVYALAAVGGAVYAGGDFDLIGGVERRNLAAVDAWGAVTSWSADANRPVFALAARGDTIYVGGTFSTLGGVARLNAGAVTSAGAVTGWTPDPNAMVAALVVDGDTIYAGGYFTVVGQQARSNVAAIALDGAILPWSTEFAGALGYAGNPSQSPDPPTGVWAIAVSGATVYVSGDFATVGGVARPGLAALDVDGRPTPFVVAHGGWPPRALAMLEGKLLAGGTYSETGYDSPALAVIDPRSGLARAALFSSTSSPGFPSSPYGEPFVGAIAAQNGFAYVGGRVWGITGGPDRRWNLAAVDAHGTTLDWDPNAFP